MINSLGCCFRASINNVNALIISDCMFKGAMRRSRVRRAPDKGFGSGGAPRIFRAPEGRGGEGSSHKLPRNAALTEFLRSKRQQPDIHRRNNSAWRKLMEEHEELLDSYGKRNQGLEHAVSARKAMERIIEQEKHFIDTSSGRTWLTERRELIEAALKMDEVEASVHGISEGVKAELEFELRIIKSVFTPIPKRKGR